MREGIDGERVTEGECIVTVPPVSRLYNPFRSVSPTVFLGPLNPRSSVHSNESGRSASERKEHSREAAYTRPRDHEWWGRAALWAVRNVVWPLLKWATIFALPFVVLMRGTLYLYAHEWPLLLAMGGGFLATFLLLWGYVGWGYSVFVAGHSKPWERRLRFEALLVILVLGTFQGYVLLHPDSGHVASEEESVEYADLHPLLRMSVGMGVLFDDGLLLTDLSRHPKEYREMGLSVNPKSLHYPQSNGYVHAFDLQTEGRSWIRNFTIEMYFQLLGFRTLRHVGTADHLHVALPLPGKNRASSERGPNTDTP